MRLGFSGKSSGTTIQLAARKISSSTSHGQPSVDVSGGRGGGLRMVGRGASGPGGRGRWPLDGGELVAICPLPSRALVTQTQSPPDLASLPGLPENTQTPCDSAAVTSSSLSSCS